MIVVLDTNVIVAAMVAKGLCHEVVVRGLGSCTVVTSQPLLDELEHTLESRDVDPARELISPPRSSMANRGGRRMGHYGLTPPA